jgi:hypothetical protein
MATLDALDIDIGGIGSNVMFATSIAIHGDEFSRCARCAYGGCDVKVSGCGCTFHGKCTQDAS